MKTRLIKKVLGPLWNGNFDDALYMRAFRISTKRGWINRWSYSGILARQAISCNRRMIRHNLRQRPNDYSK